MEAKRKTKAVYRMVTVNEEVLTLVLTREEVMQLRLWAGGASAGCMGEDMYRSARHSQRAHGSLTTPDACEKLREALIEATDRLL